MRNINWLLLFVGALIIYGCADKQVIINVDKKPEVVHRESLPSFEGKFNAKQFILETKLLVSDEGNVIDVNLLNSSGDRNWDTTTVSHLKRWKYTPAILNGRPITIWLRQSINVTVLDDFKMHLAEIVSNNLSIADSIYSSVNNGVEFGLLAKKYSVLEAEKGSGDLGIIDIRKYPESVQEKISKLKINEILKPIKIGELYYIFKRLPLKN